MSTHTEAWSSRKPSGRCGHGIRLNHVNFIDPPGQMCTLYTTLHAWICPLLSGRPTRGTAEREGLRHPRRVAEVARLEHVPPREELTRRAFEDELAVAEHVATIGD